MKLLKLTTLITAILLLFTEPINAQGTFYNVNGYNACVFVPASYNSNPNKKYPVTVFVPGAGEIGSNKDLLVKYGANAYVKQVGNSTFGGVDFIVASFQQKAQYSRPLTDKVFFDWLYANFRVDSANIFGTGLSRGWWHTGHYATYQQTANDLRFIKTYKGLCIYEGQPCDDRWDATLPYPAKFGRWAKLNDGYLLAVHNINSAFYSDKVVKSVNDSLPNHAWYFEPKYGNGGHEGWDDHYGGNGKQPAKYLTNGKSLNMYEWFASLVEPSSTNPPITTNPPTTISITVCDSLIKIQTDKLTEKDAEIAKLKSDIAVLNNSYNILKVEYETLVTKLNNVITLICNK